LTRWSIKWGTPRAIFLSSTIFGLLHAEVIGHIFFAYVMAVLYIKTRSLYVPIAAHAVNNAIAWTGSLFGSRGEAADTLSAVRLQAMWPLMLIFAVIFIPLAVRFIRQHFPKAAWRMPYATLMKSEAASSGFH
jgi:membrane protease YdiL (CAAX protease family)